jgi:hypothetical protein
LTVRNAEHPLHRRTHHTDRLLRVLRGPVDPQHDHSDHKTGNLDATIWLP